MIIKRKLIFDNPEQREFGVPWKKYIKYGAKSIKDRGLKRGIRKLRFKISDDIDKSIKANDKAQMALDAYTENTKFPKRPEVMKALGQEAKKRGIVVVKGKKEYKPVTEKVLIKEEKNATKTAMKLLRSANANPSEMIEARKELGADLGTYMHGYKSSKGKILKGIIKPNRIKKKNKKRP